MRKLIGIGIVALLSIMAVPYSYAQAQLPDRDQLGDPSGTYYVTVHGRFAVVGRGTLELKPRNDGTLTGSWHVRRRPGKCCPISLSLVR